MRELEFIDIINKTLTLKEHLGDDCAYLKDLQIVVTQDSLVEDIHFSTKFSTPYEIGYKALVVNISDILASGAIPKYITISLSLPQSISNDFIKEFYTACNDLSEEYGIEIVGGDITGSDKIFISVCAIGSTKARNISSRSNAKDGDIIITTGEYGSSAAGLFMLQNGLKEPTEFVKAHKMPQLVPAFSEQISKTSTAYTMMDTSDGLIDALFKIGKACNKTLVVDFDKIPCSKKLENFAKANNNDYKNWMLYGGEDYNLLACVDKNTLNKLPKDLYTVIGKVEDFSNSYVQIKTQSKTIEISDLSKTFNHFSN